MTVTSGSKVEVRLPSRLGFEKVAMSTAASMAKLMGFSEDRIEDLKTAIAEACINAMEHGNQMNASIPVSVVLSMNPNELEVKVLHKGSGMEVPTPPISIAK
jgi:serine/threonine-protein kinase RsbW